jgi:hypothetical protein
MLEWITSWWWSAGTFTGPARNAPNEGKNIKEIIDQKPEQINMLTSSELQNVRQRLRKTETNGPKPNLNKSPATVLEELGNIFEKSPNNYFELIRKKREETKTRLLETTNILTVITSNNEPEITFDVVISETIITKENGLEITPDVIVSETLITEENKPESVFDFIVSETVITKEIETDQQ